MSFYFWPDLSARQAITSDLTPYRSEYYPGIGVNWLWQQRFGGAWLGVMADEKDRLFALTESSILCRYPLHAPSDALPLIGEDRNMIRGFGESDADYSSRLQRNWDFWEWSGTALGIIINLQASGFYGIPWGNPPVVKNLSATTTHASTGAIIFVDSSAGSWGSPDDYVLITRVDGTEIANKVTFKWNFGDGTGVETLPDGSMEAVGISNWVAGVGADATKESGAQSGSQCLKVARTSGAAPRVQASGPYMIADPSRPGLYRVVGYAKSDGTNAPRLYDGATVIWTGTTATTWQSFDFEYEASDYFYLGFDGSSGHVFFDSMSRWMYPSLHLQDAVTVGVGDTIVTLAQPELFNPYYPDSESSVFVIRNSDVAAGDLLDGASQFWSRFWLYIDTDSETINFDGIWSDPGTYDDGGVWDLEDLDGDLITPSMVAWWKASIRQSKPAEWSCASINIGPYADAPQGLVQIPMDSYSLALGTGERSEFTYFGQILNTTAFHAATGSYPIATGKTTYIDATAVIRCSGAGNQSAWYRRIFAIESLPSGLKFIGTYYTGFGYLSATGCEIGSEQSAAPIIGAGFFDFQAKLSTVTDSLSFEARGPAVGYFAVNFREIEL